MSSPKPWARGKHSEHYLSFLGHTPALFVAGGGLVMNVCDSEYKPSVFFWKSTEASCWQVNLSFCNLGL